MIVEKTVPFGYIFNKVKRDLLNIMIFAVITHFLAKRLDHLLPEMPTYIPALLGTAISILLSFKMNQSYDRWWEARKVWGAIVNDARSLILQLQGFVRAGHPVITTIAYRQIAFCYALAQTLRGHDAMESIKPFLGDDDSQIIGEHKNKPLALLQLIAADLKKMRDSGELDVLYHIQIDDTLVRLCDSMGKAERIKSTVFPSTYRMFLHFAIYVFALTLSIALNDVGGIFALPLLAVISSCFLLIEKSAYHLQDPFANRPSDTPVSAISRTIEINIRQLLGEKNVPPPVEPSDFYLM